jgi:TonB-like protein
MKIPHRLNSLLLLASATLAVAQVSSVQLPCDYSGKLLRSDKGEIVRFASDEMKERATHKTDVSGFMKRTDIKGTVIVVMLVDPAGKVFCEKSLIGHPIIRDEVEKALRAWTFKPSKMDGEPVAYVGEMDFFLCNINCGELGFSTTLLK